ncbi:hypothetical protein [Alteraurantiacibacter aestuarii]
MTTIWRDPVGWWCSLGRPLQHLSPRAAMGVLLALVLALGWASWATGDLGRADDARIAAKTGERIGDLELYARIHERFHDGENYYAAAMAEQREHNYPTRPFVTVRLPTLAWIDGQLNAKSWRVIATVLLIGMVLIWLSAFTPLATMAERAGAVVVLFLSGAGAYDARAMVFHELVAGLLLTLSLGLYRPQRWWPSLILAALALAVRELALPFVMLWGAFTLWQRKWAEALAIAGVILAFVIALFFHAQGVAAHAMPGDLASPGWAAFNGPQMGLLAMAKLTPLLFLPVPLAAPIALIALLGWIALGGRLGLFASLWFIGFGIALSLFARTNNFYWVLLLLPAYAAGLAFVPRALVELVQRATGARATGKQTS